MVESSKAHIIDRIFRLKNIIYELKSREYVTEEPKLFLNSLIYYIDKFKNRLEEIAEDDMVSIRRIGHLLQIIHVNLDEIEHIRTVNIPIELLPFLNNILKDNDAKYNVIYRPSTEFNYSYWNYSNFMNEACSGLNVLPDQLLSVISFPLSESDNILLNCILFHEIGHQLNDELNIREDIKNSIKITPKNLDKYVEMWMSRLSGIKEVIGEREITLYTFFSRNELIRSQLVEELYETLYNWIDEIISDLIAFHYISIAYLLAFTELGYVHGSTTSCSDSHPPIFLRLRAIFKLYNLQEYGKKIQPYGNITKFIAFYKNIARHSFSKEKETINTFRNSIFEKTIMKIMPNILEHIRRKVQIPKTNFVAIQIENAINSFIDLIPPAEYINYKLKTKKLHSKFTILNAAWIVKENYQKRMSNIFQNNQQLSRMAINNLTIKALESNEFYQRMVKNK